MWKKNLCALPGVDQAVVVCREAADGRALRLIAFVIPKQEDPPTRAEIQALLAHRLPDYMRPSIQLIKNFPLTENGKCDRKRLKEIANGRQILKLIQDIGNNGENIGPEQELLESGILDSLAFITLLEEIAVRWRIEIQPTQVPPEEWKTVRSIARMLEKKMVEKTS